MPNALTPVVLMLPLLSTETPVPEEDMAVGAVSRLPPVSMTPVSPAVSVCWLVTVWPSTITNEAAWAAGAADSKARLVAIKIARNLNRIVLSTGAYVSFYLIFILSLALEGSC